MMFPEIYLQKQNFSPEIKDRPDPLLNICVVIPCYNEPCLLQSLQSLWRCTRPEMTVEVFIVINAPENCPKLITERNLATLSEAKNWINGHTDAKLKFHLIYRPDLPLKFAGVGLARKIGMDEAVYRLMLCRNFKGIVTGFDADSTCDPNYLVELEKHFTVHTKSNGASIYFEHPISGAEYTSEHYAGIILYELHLRYLNQALRYARHPYAFHTIGSSFAVRMDAYVKQGGMNKRQAGEDFYFLQKIIELGNFTEINTTCIIPSPRESDRVPFGTGAAMKHWFADKALKTYCFNAFEDLLAFTTVIEELYSDGPETILSILNSLPISLQEFLRNNNFENELKSIRTNSASLATFRSRFFRWFNAFKVIKYLNFTNEKYHTKVDICTEAIKLTTKLRLYREIEKPVELLNLYRHLDRSGIGLIQQ
jgi:hypothetical protein